MHYVYNSCVCICVNTFEHFALIYTMNLYTFYHILEVSYCVIQILMQTVRPRAVLWSVQSK